MIRSSISLVCLLLALAITASAASARSVSLSDAHVAPQSLSYVYPHASLTITRQCGRSGYWTETNAYRWNGSALSDQRWNADHTVTYWQAPSGRKVTFDGITWRNHTTRPVLVAGWCS